MYSSQDLKGRRWEHKHGSRGIVTRCLLRCSFKSGNSLTAHLLLAQTPAAPQILPDMITFSMGKGSLSYAIRLISATAPNMTWAPHPCSSPLRWPLNRAYCPLNVCLTWRTSAGPPSQRRKQISRTNRDRESECCSSSSSRLLTTCTQPSSLVCLLVSINQNRHGRTAIWPRASIS